ncbi:Cytosolic carboxypeptidase 6 like protein [Argiope bruennichi]|uniref:Cytosolic carboxypeptidase 6 like protein n=1 Tax=Argiope bruennichi TaxID=94029 RepID=A0A8T0FU23_ARGBR|nr:Cytosolic carboxypeptidase 6 like protein [Argiope bruennichi]
MPHSNAVGTNPVGKWVRIPSNCVFYYRCPEHGNRYVLSIVFAFDKEDDVYHFAFSYPYSYTRLQKYMESLESKQLPFFKREKIGETLRFSGFIWNLNVNQSIKQYHFYVLDERRL